MHSTTTRKCLRRAVLVLAALAAAAALAATPKTMSVQVRQTDLRATPSFLAAPAGTLRYGDRVTVLTEQPGWYQVSLNGTEPAGWVNGSALTHKTIVLQSGEAAHTAASSGELALAGKGFNSSVEAQFKAGHRDVDFACVDRMERRRVTPPQALEFLKAGGLTPVVQEVAP